MRNWLLVLILSAIAVAPVGFLSYHYGKSVPETEKPIASLQFGRDRPREMEVGAKYEVKACKVLDGYRFELYLEGDKYTEAHLKSATKDDAGPVVVELLNKATSPPSVTLLRKTGDHWIVDFELSVDGRTVDLLDLLRSKGLLL